MPEYRVSWVALASVHDRQSYSVVTALNVRMYLVLRPNARAPHPRIGWTLESRAWLSMSNVGLKKLGTMYLHTYSLCTEYSYKLCAFFVPVRTHRTHNSATEQHGIPRVPLRDRRNKIHTYLCM